MPFGLFQWMRFRPRIQDIRVCAMGMADVATVLFTKFMKFDASTPDWFDRDRFILSAGHGSMLLYSTLYLMGYPGVELDDLKNFRQVGSKTAGHPEYGHISGAEMTTGPLGQGLTTGVGFAIAEKMVSARHGDEILRSLYLRHQWRWLFDGRCLARSHRYGWPHEAQ